MSAFLILVVLAAVPEPVAESRVAGVLGEVTAERSGRLYEVEAASELQPGDRLNTGPGAGATVVLDENHAVDLGPQTRLELQQGGPDGWTLRLERGEVRAVSGNARLILASGSVLTRAGRGIFRLAAGPQGTRVWSEDGSLTVTAAPNTQVALETGQEVTVPTTGAASGPHPVNASGWSLQPERLRLACAGLASRRRKRHDLVEVNNGSARSFRPAGGTPLSEGTQPPAAPEAATQPPQGQQELEASSSLTQPTGASAVSLALGNVSTASGFGASGGLFSDAQQDTLNPAFPGNIYLVTAETQYRLNNVLLQPRDAFPVAKEFWSIGAGTPPTSQVVTTFRTASDPVPMTIAIPRTDAYLVRFPQNQYGIPDPAISTNATNASGALGIAGLLGAPPTAPQVQNATPLIDHRALINDRATFALGEFAVQTTQNQHGHTVPLIDVRRSDQDRQIIKSLSGNDNFDKVTPNPEVKFINAPDPKFFPELPTVKKPAPNLPGDPTFAPQPTYSRLDRLRQAALTTLMADRLFDYSRRTGQTRFTLDGKSVVDISGFRPGGAGQRPFSRVDVLRQNFTQIGTGPLQATAHHPTQPR